MPDLIGYVMIVAKVSAITGAALAIPIEDLDALLNQWEREDTLLPILDPTAFMYRSPKIEKRMEIIRAFTTFRKAIEEHKDLWSDLSVMNREENKEDGVRE
jgi:hypothetical protein